MRLWLVVVLMGLAAGLWWALIPATPSLDQIRTNMLALEAEVCAARAAGTALTPAQMRARVEAMDWPDSPCGYRVNARGVTAWSVICEPHCEITSGDSGWGTWRLGHVCEMPLRMFILPSWDPTAMELVLYTSPSAGVNEEFPVQPPVSAS